MPTRLDQIQSILEHYVKLVEKDEFGDEIAFLVKAGAYSLRTEKDMQRLLDAIKWRGLKHPNWIPEILPTQYLLAFLKFCNEPENSGGWGAANTAFSANLFMGRMETSPPMEILIPISEGVINPNYRKYRAKNPKNWINRNVEWVMRVVRSFDPLAYELAPKTRPSSDTFRHAIAKLIVRMVFWKHSQDLVASRADTVVMQNALSNISRPGWNDPPK